MVMESRAGRLDRDPSTGEEPLPRGLVGACAFHCVHDETRITYTALTDGQQASSLKICGELVGWLVQRVLQTALKSV
jgi:hypothetical protein